MIDLVQGLRAAQLELARRPVDQILSVLERVAARWLDPTDPIRRAAITQIAAGTGLAPSMLADGLGQMVGRIKGIADLLDQDLGSRYALDRLVVRHPGLSSRAWGPGLLVCIFSGNVPGIPAFDLALSLALKSACLARPAAGEPVFAHLFARSVREVDELMGRCLAVTRWDKGETWPYAQAGAVLAYGSDPTIAAIKLQVPPGVHFVGHGHRLSFALVARAAATPETAAALALDVAMYDQQGCVSPHMAFVERNGPLAPSEFAQACGAALAELEQRMPRGRLDQADAVAIRSARDEAEFAADALFASHGDLAWAVIHQERPDFLPSPLGRLLRTYSVDDLAEVLPLTAPHAQWLQSIAIAAQPARRAQLAEALGAAGASRICPVGRMQQPDPLWRHDGRPTAGALVRWTDLES